MIQLEDILEVVVNGLDPVFINPTLSKKPVFYWGVGADLPQFIQVYKEGSIPLIWSITKPDTRKQGFYTRDAELCFCTRQTRELLNTARMEESFKHVLFPLWESFESGVRKSHNMDIISDGTVFAKHPNFSVSEAKKERPVLDIWDVLKVSFKVNFYEDNNC